MTSPKLRLVDRAYQGRNRILPTALMNPRLAQSIADAAWYQFRQGIEYFGTVFGVVTVAVL